ncbi:MAG: hypothetical protein JW932_02150, partial [Deltaproteobacteria bacterium]|nr:hypothetical protein [Deltaproteobacteria bacterium]
PQAYYRYGEDQNHETSFIVKALQAAVDDSCKIQVLTVSSLSTPTSFRRRPESSGFQHDEPLILL